jgi:nucleotide-binding universal stress UspA family protein
LWGERRRTMIDYPKYKKVLFCTDFSENSDYAFGFAYGIAKRDKGLLYLLHVIPENPHQIFAMGMITPEQVEQIQKGFQEDLDNNYEERYVKKMGDEIEFEIVTKSGREDEEILNFAKAEKVDIIVLGTYGKTGIEHVIFGSVAEKVLRQSPFPVFVIPCRKKLERP